nr:hypothetical protein [Tanacetum cinerariifolium]
MIVMSFLRFLAWNKTKDLHTADYTQLYNFLKYNQKEVDELKAERLAKIQDPLALMANSINPYASPVPHQDVSPFNQNYLQQPMINPKDITDPTTAMNMALSLMAKAFKLNYSTPTNNNHRISSNPRNRQIAQPGQNAGNLNGYNTVQNVGNQVAQNPRVQNVRNQNGPIGVQGNRNQNQIGNGNIVAVRAEGNAVGHNGNQIRCYNCRGIGHFARDCIVRPRRRDAAYLQTQLLIAQKEEAGIQLQAEEYDLMPAAADLDELEEVNTNCILMANLQQASSLEEQYTELLEPIPEPQQVPQNDNNVISEQCLITINHDVCVLNYVNGMNSRGKKQKANVSNIANLKKHMAQVWKPKNVGSKERVASPKPSTPRSCLRWSPTRIFFDLTGKLIVSSESESQSNCSKGNNACTSNPQEPISRRFPNSTFSMTGGQNWFDTLLIPLLFEYKPKDKEDHRDNECDT